MTPGEFIRPRIRPAGHNQTTLAEAIGVSGAYINQLVHDHRTPSDETVTKLARALKLTEEERLTLRRLVLGRRAEAVRRKLADLAALEAELPAPESAPEG
jgi:plasmid maintenance system antidote protein VapI